jgi:chromate transporter
MCKLTRQKGNLYWKLFVSTFMISAFTFGGGYVIAPLIKKRFVEDLKLLTEKEMLDIVAIATSSPGVLAVNTSLLAGYKAAGFVGALVTMLGSILPPIIIMSVIGLIYDLFINNPVVAAVLKGMQAAVAALLAEAVFNLSKSVIMEKKLFAYIILGAAFTAAFFFDINVAVIIMVCAGLGLARSFFPRAEQ